MRGIPQAEQNPGPALLVTDDLLRDSEFTNGPAGRSEKLADALGQAAAQANPADWMTEAARLTAGSRELHGGVTREQRLIGHIFGDETGVLTTSPPTEALQQARELNSLIVLAAGQPVVVLKPGRTWFDIGLLESPELPDAKTGLQIPGNPRHRTKSVVLPVRKSVTIGIGSGEEVTDLARQFDDELQARSERPVDVDEEPTRPLIDALTTRVLFTAEDIRSVSPDGVTTYILVGDDWMQQTLNRVLGFDMHLVEDDLMAQKRFFAIFDIQKSLEHAGIKFDIDMVDGYLAHRIADLRRDRRQRGPLASELSITQAVSEQSMLQKLAAYAAAGWISAPDQPDDETS